MKNKRRVTKIVCYILALIMVMSCFCVTSYGVEGDAPQTDIVVDNGDSTDVNTPAANEGEDTDPIVNPDGDEGQGGAPDDSTTEPVDTFNPAAISAKLAKAADGSMSILVEWDAVDGAQDYTATCNENTVTTTEETASFEVVEGVNVYTVKTVANLAEGATKEYNQVVVNVDAATEGKTIDEAPVVTQVWGTQADNVGKTFKFTEASFKDGYNSHKVVIDNRTTITWTKPAIEPKKYKLLKNGAAPYVIDPTNPDLLIESDTKPTFKDNGDGTCTFAYSPKGGTYAFSIVAVYDDVELESPAATEVKVPTFLTGAVRTYKFYAKTNTRAKFYKKGKGNSYKRWLSKGVTGTITGGSGSKFLVEGTKYGSGYVMRAKMSCYKLDYSPKVDWTKTKKEYYVNNSSKFKSSKSRIVWVSRYAQKVNIFKKVNGKWVLERQAECTTGKFRNYTAGGSYTIHTRTYKRNRSTYWYRYLSKFNGVNSLHGPTYYKKSLQMKARPSSHMGTKGEWGTLGCVRMWNEDAFWVWNHCPKGTKVVVY